MEALHTLEIAITLWMQSLGTFLIEPMRFISFFGVEDFYIILMPILYWCVDASVGLRLGIMLLLGQMTNSVIKMSLRLPRPYWIDPRVQAFSSETSFGAPSGHAQSAAAIWGMLAASLRKGWVTALCAALIFLIGISRIYLGMHFASDVVLGWLLGGLLVILYLWLEKPLSTWIKHLSLGRQILLAGLTSMLMLLLPLAAASYAPDWRLPQLWLDQSASAVPDVTIDPLNIRGIFTIAGTWFGFLGGAAYIWKKCGKLNARGPAHHRLLRYMFGLAGVLVLWYGLGALFPRSDDALGYALRYLRYSLVGVWIAALAPLFFRRIGIGSFLTPSDPG